MNEVGFFLTASHAMYGNIGETSLLPDGALMSDLRLAEYY
jgi:hypothetical protein